MPPLNRRDIMSLVRKLGAEARPAQQVQALDILTSLCGEGVPTMEALETLAAIAAAGAIPPLAEAIAAAGVIPDLVKLLSEFGPDEHLSAARALAAPSGCSAENCAAVADATEVQTDLKQLSIE
ncbi:hypothetical protein FOA52_003224 [Chlamydomonas sp. UWO 241]|nr:hypothetical protein FOA52_003224 [Chlamydomonas sp. UWO 241]